MRILVTGAKGRLGSRLVTLLRAQGHAVTGIDLDEADITQREAVTRVFAEAQPEIAVHCAALTAVDYCAEHPEEALRVNALGTQNVALACQANGAALLYVSTNEVFAGERFRQHLEYDQPAPVNPYGYSKWAGEQMVRALVSRHYVVRTAWLFAHGGRNFIQTVLGRAQQGLPLRVVTNEVGNPTYNDDLAAALAQLLTTQQYGTYHLTNAGYASRYEFARHVLDLAGYAHVPIAPITLAQYPRASRPPRYAVLRNFAAAHLGITLRPWQKAVAAFLRAEGLLAERDDA